MSRHSSRLAIQSRPTPPSGRSFTAAYAGAALMAPRSRPSHWKSVLRPLALALWVPLALAAWCVPMAHAAGPLPQGGAFVRGQGAISSGTASLTIDQSSSRGVIDWHTFSIGNGNTVAFNNGSSATLNRVTGGNPSSILGKLTATGSLYVLNPQGIVVGPSGVVSTGGRFVASTLDICNDDFMNSGNSLMLSGKSDASVINLGRISSSGGDVFLIARNAVVNGGTVSAPNGSAEMAAGAAVMLQDSSTGKQVFVQTGSGGTVINMGAVRAAQINLDAADGNIYALAGGGTRLRATGTATRSGHVWLTAATGLVNQDGTVTATNAGGSGGTVDTQATRLSFGPRAEVRSGQWNVTTPSLYVDNTIAAALQRSLTSGTSITAATTGANGATGDVGVNSNVVWQGPASLTLDAYRNVSVSSGTKIANSGAGSLVLRADTGGIDNGGGVSNAGTLDWSASTGTIGAFYDMNGFYAAGTQLLNPAWAADPNSGLVAQASAYKLVNTLLDLKNVAQDLSGNYALGKDIDASATSDGSYVPIGNAVTPFTGQFEGQGHSITSLTLEPWTPTTTGDPQLMGLFGSLGSTAVVRNMNVNATGYLGVNPVVPVFGYVYGHIGVLAGVSSGKVVRVNTSGNLSSGSSVSVDSSSAGGLLGVNTGSVLQSSSSASLTSGGALGGLVGYNAGSISQSFATGPLQSSGYIASGAGGLVGNNAGSISQSYATGSTSYRGYCRGSVGTPCGGAALVAINSGTISQSFATGKVTQPNYEPIGIARTNTGTIANDVYWNRETTGASVGVEYGTTVPATNGLTSAQMGMTSSFATYDFSATGAWAMPPGATHPVLRWQASQ